MDGLLSLQRDFSFDCPGVTAKGRCGMVRVENITAYTAGA